MRKLFILFLLSITLSACEDFIQQDIEGFGVVLLTPPENHSTSLAEIQFKWEPVPHADSYRIQIVEPSFNGPTAFILDSLINTTEWFYNLAPGNYEWRVRAENNISYTQYYERSLSVLPTNDLTGQLPQLVAPVDLLKTNAQDLTFSWTFLPGAIDHRFQLTDLSTNTDLINNILTTDTFLWSGFNEGNYRWGVQAQNPNTNSQFSYREFTVDRSAPTLPVHTSPANGSTLSAGNLSFEWTSGVDAWTSVTDTIFIVESTTMTQWTYAGVNGIHADSLAAGTYEWKVRSVDELGYSSVSDPWTVTLQ